MPARAYRSVPSVEPPPRAPLDSAMVFVGVVTWLAALADVVGVVARRDAFRGLDAIALLTVIGLTLVFARAALARLWRGSRERA